MIKKQWSSFLFLSIGILMLAGCDYKHYYDYNKVLLKKTFFAGPLHDGRATIFIHGSKTSITSRIVHTLDYPLGLVPYCITKQSSVLSRIAVTLSNVAPDEYPLEEFYFYGWGGTINFPARLKASERLYNVIKKHKGPLTIITHSHGCNVALNLAYWAELEGNTELKVDRLILLAPPVQEVTKQFVHCPFFKEVYTFYSTGDLLQIGDPQALYWESYGWTAPRTKIPFFSRRTFDPGPTVIQTRIMLDYQSPGHLNFMLARFIRKMPAIMKLVKEASEKESFECTKNCFIVNIPPLNLPPHLLSEAEIKNRYVPRGNYYKLKRNLPPGHDCGKNCF